MSPFRRLPTIFTNCVSLITAYSAGSQTPSADGKSAWPTAKVIKLVVGYPPGGGIDFTARTIQAPLAEALKPQVVVDYKPRASGMLAATELNRTAADGYTLLVANTGPFVRSATPVHLHRPDQSSELCGCGKERSRSQRFERIYHLGTRE
jgi:tripartite-type tricarboxylate transporter receptor subunit TctC